MEDEYNVYETFITTNRYGDEIELAIVDRFEFEGRSFVVTALVKGDEVLEEDGLFMYEAVGEGENASYEKIADADEYSRISEAYFDSKEDTK